MKYNSDTGKCFALCGKLQDSNRQLTKETVLMAIICSLCFQNDVQLSFISALN